MPTNAASLRATAEAMARAGAAAAVVLVEGITDRIALETAARVRGRDLGGEGVVVVPIGGAHAIGRTLAELGRTPVAGLCDRREAGMFRDQVTTVVCDRDLEEELIRAAGLDAVAAIFAAEGDLRSFRSFQKQPAWRGQELPAQMYRFIRSSSRRNLRYARLLTERAVPPPLDEILKRLMD
ncbi:TOPRIM nucleotidyl transferase/hydrolase domain-containing protein [Actinoplanes sp. NPDC023714]|uniref:TOPRIM nucleotidyl transferase/hydrolase domain-containing protein n=1 Tax=Actinoplanes sp. NPDC023714 TaxID=3154322 RepID=UPI0033F7F91B